MEEDMMEENLVYGGSDGRWVCGTKNLMEDGPFKEEGPDKGRI